MSLRILYHNPELPEAAGMTMISGQAEAAEIVDRLEARGFVVDKITQGPTTTHAVAADG